MYIKINANALRTIAESEAEAIYIYLSFKSYQYYSNTILRIIVCNPEVDPVQGRAIVRWRREEEGH